MKLYALALLIFSFTIVAEPLYAESHSVTAQDDTVTAKECVALPIIDGMADDACWAAAKWQPIDQVWIPWGATMDSTDFSGRYKVTWSSQTDRVYFLVEVVDDVLVDGYKYPMDGYYNWDVVELFFDEDASGGDHKLNQNAFAYHITAGNDEVGFEAMDLGPNWKVENYSSHFDCVIGKKDGVYLWEIAMIVYNQDYNPDATGNPTEELYPGKVSGLSIAYCDNDEQDENPKTRDNFIGSVEVPAEHFNDHWINADWFGTVKFVPADEPANVLDYPAAPVAFSLHQNYPNPFNPTTTIEYALADEADVHIAIYNAMGEKIVTLDNSRQQAGLHLVQWDGLNENHVGVPSGIYFYQLSASANSGIYKFNRKMLLTR